MTGFLLLALLVTATPLLWWLLPWLSWALAYAELKAAWIGYDVRLWLTNWAYRFTWYAICAAFIAAANVTVLFSSDASALLAGIAESIKGRMFASLQDRVERLWWIRQRQVRRAFKRVEP